MITARHNPLLRYLHRIAGRTETKALSDGQLLARFAEQRDEAAFEVLLARHGPMVLAVCRRVLGDLHAAEDAFQATFLVLTRKSRAIGRRELVGPWLFRVAYHTALRARARHAQRSFHERRVAPRTCADPGADVVWRDLGPVLDDEVSRLPAKYQRPFVLCYLEGKTNEEAARQLGCPTGTVKVRLARARARLQQRLLRRGVSLPAAGLTALLAPAAAKAAVPAALARVTNQAAALAAAGPTAAAGLISENVVMLAEGVLKTMGITKLKLAAVVLAFCAVGMGAYYGWSTQPPDGPGGEGRYAPPSARETSEVETPPPARKPAKKNPATPKELYDRAVAAFLGEDMPAAEKGFRAVVNHPATDDALKNQALFYLHASLHRQEKHREAVRVGDRWLTLYPKDKTRNYVLLFQGISHQQLVVQRND